MRATLHRDRLPAPEPACREHRGVDPRAPTAPAARYPN